MRLLNKLMKKVFAKPEDSPDGLLNPEQEESDEKVVEYWLLRVKESEKRLKDFREDGQEAVKIYEADKDDVVFNILYSNTETLSPALYSAPPKPVVTRRFKDEDPLGMLAAKATERMLSYLADTNSGNALTLDEALAKVTPQALVPGWGNVFVSYDATFKKSIVPKIAPSAETLDASGEEVEEPGETSEEVEDIDDEYICFDPIPWDRFNMGYGKTWKQVPWVSVTHYLSRAELIDNYGEEIGRKIELTATSKEADKGAGDEEGKGTQGEGDVNLGIVYEIWNKTRKEVIFVSPGLKEVVLKRVPDPFGLSGFFPCPPPMMFVTKISSQTPVSLYSFYKEQARELNNLTRRAKGLIASLKYRGFYDQTVEGIENVLRAEENTLTPVANVAALMPGQTLERVIWTVPVDMLATTLQQVMAQREVCKSVIYEITGMSDIIRGSSVASETATAQKIKSQWGGLRIKKFQKEVQRYARDLLRIAAEMGVARFQETTWRAMTGMPYPTGAEKQQLQMEVQQAQLQGLPLPPDAEVRLKAPSWKEILGLLRDNVQRKYRVDVETNSTVEVDATEDKQQVSELLNAIAQLMSGLSPMVESGSMPFQVAQSLLLTVVRRYRFGPEIEESLKLMQPPKPPEDPKAGQNQIELQKAQMEMQARQQELVQEAELAKMKHQIAMEELQQKQQMANEKHQFEMMKLRAETAKMAIEASLPKEETAPGGE